MKGIWKGFLIGIVSIVMPLSAATREGAVITCDDGRTMRASPFGIPALMCGEFVRPEKPAIDPDFIAIYGEKPTRETTGLTGRELRRVRFLWEWTRGKWGGVVSPMDARDPDNAANPDAVKSAISIDQLNLEFFNEDRLAQLAAWFQEYGLGEPIYTLMKASRSDADREFVEGYYLAVKFTKLPPTFAMSEEIALKYPQLGIANAQVRMSREGICYDKQIAILRAVEHIACTVPE